jgi:transposase
MKSYSQEFRANVLAACDANEGTHAVALRFKVSKSWVRRVVQQRRETGQVAAKTTRKRTPIWEEWTDWLRAKLDARPDVYLRELQAELKAERDVKVSLQTICNACRVLERTRKKRRSSPQNKIGPTSPSGGASGARRKPTSNRAKSFSSTKPGRKPT